MKSPAFKKTIVIAKEIYQQSLLSSDPYGWQKQRNLKYENDDNSKGY